MANELHEAAASQEGLAEVKRLIETELFHVNTPHTKHHTRAVEFAAQSGSLATLRYLIEEAKADVEASSSVENLLSWSVDNPSTDVLEYLTDPKNDLLKKFNDGTTELHAAVIKGDEKWVGELLLSAPHLLSMTTRRGESALSLAASLGRPSLVHLITSHPVFLSIDRIDKYDPQLRGQAQYANKLALFFKQNKMLSEAITRYQEAIRSYRLMYNKEEGDYLYQVGTTYLSLSECYYDNYYACSTPTLENHLASQAEVALRHAISCFEAISDKTDQIYKRLVDCHVLLGHLAYNIEHPVDAAQEYEKAGLWLQCMSQKDMKRLTEIEKLYETTICQDKMSQETKKWGFTCEDVPGDGACFFHAAQRQLVKLDYFNPLLTSDHLRSYTLKHMKKHFDLYKSFLDDDQPADKYLEHAAKKSAWVDNLMIQAFSRKLNVTLVIIRDDGAPPTVFKRPSPEATLYFGYQVNRHYQALHPIPDGVPSQSIEDVIRDHPIDEWSGNTLKRISEKDSPPSTNKRPRPVIAAETEEASDKRSSPTSFSFFKDSSDKDATEKRQRLSSAVP